MSVSFPCPACAARLRIDDAHAGRRVRCRACERVVIAALEDDDPGFRIVEREPDAAALRALVTPGAPSRRTRRKVAFAAAAGAVLVALVAVGWLVLFQTPTFPDLVGELPDGDSAVYRNAAGTAFFSAEPFPFPDARDCAVLSRGAESLRLYGGDFKPAALTEDLRARGYAAETADGEKAYVYPDGREAIAVSRNRILVGPKALVFEALAARRGKARRFGDGLTATQRSVLKRLGRGDWWYFGKAPTAQERARIGTETRGLLEGIPLWPHGAGCAVRVSGETAEATVAVGYGAPDERGMARTALEYLGGFLDGLRDEAQGRVAAATGRLRKAKLDCRANEAEAAAALRAIARAARDRRTGDVASLPGLDPEIAAADAYPLSDTVERRARRGYWFLAMKTGAAFCAYPARPGETGVRTFVLDEQDEMWEKDTGGAPVTAWSADLDGWTATSPPRGR
ncbi:MAG: DUF2950 family protein [Planctomycetes bacterium]|nr:DUF2950 family protein [Planctomycetota bacterium]